MKEILDDVTWDELLPGDVLTGAVDKVFEMLVVIAVRPGESCTFFQTFSARAPELNVIHRSRMSNFVKKDFFWQRVFRPCP